MRGWKMNGCLGVRTAGRMYVKTNVDAGRKLTGGSADCWGVLWRREMDRRMNKAMAAGWPYLRWDLRWRLGRRGLWGFKFKWLLFWFGVVPEKERARSVSNIKTTNRLRNKLHYKWLELIGIISNWSLPGLRCSLLLRRVSGGYGGNLLCVGQQRCIWRLWEGWERNVCTEVTDRIENVTALWGCAQAQCWMLNTTC